MCGLTQAVVALCQREGVLELRADGQQRPGAGTRQRERERRVAARAAQDDRAARRGPHHGVVAPRDDLAVVQQEARRRCRRSRARASSLPVAIGSSLRLPLVITSGRPAPRRAAAGAAGVYGKHDARPWRVPGDTEAASVRRARPGAARSAAPRERSSRSASRIQYRERARLLERAHHDRERLRLALLALAQPLHGGVVGRRPPPGGSRPARGSPRSGRRGATSRPPRAPRSRTWRGPCARALVTRPLEPEPRPARRAAVRLRVVAPVAGVAYSAAHAGALGERAHAGALAVVRQALDDGVARAAVGAGDERVAEPAVAGSRSSARQASHRATSAGTAGAVPGSSPALARIAKSLAAAGRDRLDLHRARSAPAAAPRRAVPLANLSRCSGVPSTSISTAPAVLRTQPASACRRGQPMHERAEADALHHARDGHVTGGRAPRRPRRITLGSGGRPSAPAGSRTMCPCPRRSAPRSGGWDGRVHLAQVLLREASTSNGT